MKKGIFLTMICLCGPYLPTTGQCASRPDGGVDTVHGNASVGEAINAGQEEQAMESKPNGKVVTYPAPPGARVSDLYRVTVNGHRLDVYAMNTDMRDGKYYFVYFDFAGQANVEIAAERDLSRTLVRPSSYGIQPQREKHRVTLRLDRPRKISVEPDGPNSALLIMANPLESDPPAADTPGLVHFGPGIHDAGRIRLKSNETLYLAGGAVVKGCVEVQGTNVTIRGRGMLYGGDYAHLKGPRGGWGGGYMFHILKSADVTVRDIILCDAWHWTLVPRFSDRIVIDNVKILCSRFYHEDGIDVVNCRDVTISDCFIRTKDDCIAIKGHNRDLSCERIRVQDCVFWTDGANAFRIGFESEVSGLMAKDLVAKNIDIIHVAEPQADIGQYWAHSVFYIQPCDNTPMGGMRFEDIRIESDGKPFNLIKIEPMVRKGWGWKGTEPGRSVKDVTFKNMRVVGTGRPSDTRIHISGRNPDRKVSGIVFENCVIDGHPLQREHIRTGPMVEAIDVRNQER